jgi:hypothetical protein
MKTIVKLKEAAGKTISAVEFSFDNEQVVIAFTDGSFAAVRTAISYIGDNAPYLEDGYFELFDFVGLDQLIRAGIATKDELADLRVRRNAAEAADREKQERGEYERLRAKYDPPAEPEWDYDSKNPDSAEVGWYATLFCWDSNEGTFAGGNRWFGDRWENNLPVYAWVGPFSTMVEADEWARAHNPEDM